MKVFISHSMDEGAWAEALRKNLQDRGLSVWSGSIKQGQNLQDIILEEISKSDAIIAVLRKQPFSPNVMTEVGIAFGQGKTIISVTPERTVTFPLPIRSIITDDPGLAAAQIAEILTRKSV